MMETNTPSEVTHDFRWETRDFRFQPDFQTRHFRFLNPTVQFLNPRLSSKNNHLLTDRASPSVRSRNRIQREPGSSWSPKIYCFCAFGGTCLVSLQKFSVQIWSTWDSIKPHQPWILQCNTTMGLSRFVEGRGFLAKWDQPDR